MSSNLFQDTDISFGQRLKSFRKLKGLKGAELAKLMGISAATLSAVENDKTITSASAIGYLIQNSKINIYWLFTGKGDMLMEGGVPDRVVDIDTQYAELVSRFHNKPLAKKINYDLLEIEQLNKDALKSIADKVEGMLEGLRLAHNSAEDDGKKTA